MQDFYCKSKKKKIIINFSPTLRISLNFFKNFIKINKILSISKKYSLIKNLQNYLKIKIKYILDCKFNIQTHNHGEIRQANIDDSPWWQRKLCLSMKLNKRKKTKKKEVCHLHSLYALMPPISSSSSAPTTDYII